MRILFCATDAGGARNIKEIVKESVKREFEISVIGSSATIPIFSELNLEIDIYKAENIEYDSLKEFLTNYNPQSIIVGATRFFGIDRRLVQLAKVLEIFSITVLDEWYYYRNRFLDAVGNMSCLPDIICCPDNLAVEEAVTEGIPKQLLRITGSPALSEVWNKRTEFSENLSEIPGIIKHAGKPIILFLSETHKDDYGVDDRGGRLGKFLGYTEESVFNRVMEIIVQLNLECTVIEKLHPSADIPAGWEMDKVKYSRINWIKINHAPLLPLIWYSNIVIGMRSMALLEAYLLGKPTVSFQPGLKNKDDLTTAERLGLIKRFESDSDLENWIQKNISSHSVFLQSREQVRPEFADVNAVQNILNLIPEFN